MKLMIVPSYIKNKLIKENNLNDIKYIDEYELQDKYLYTYKEDTILYIHNTYKYSFELCKIIMNNLYDIQDINYNNKKLDNLRNIKNDLISKGYIIFNKNFKSYLKNKDIQVLGTFSKRIEKVIKELEKINNVTYIKETPNKKEVKVYKYKTILDEVINTSSKIVDLVNSGIDINKIYVNTLSDEYRTLMIRIFDYYGIPNNFKQNTLYSLTSKLLKSIPDNTKILDINEILDNSSLLDNIKNKLVEVFNKYVDYDVYSDIKDIVIYETKNTKLIDKKVNIVKEIDYKNTYLDNDEYIFIMGINEDILPVIHKDNDYLSDKEKEVLDIDNSNDLNIKDTNYFNNYINSNNVYLSYKLKNKSTEYEKAYILEGIDELEEKYKYDNKKVNEMLLGISLDKYTKYNEKDENLSILSNYNIAYETYDNSYKRIDLDTIKKEINNKITMSPSSSDIFYKCKFRYLLNNIYRLSEKENTISQDIGNLFHEVLYRYFKEKGNLNSIIDDEINKMYQEKTIKDEFYIKKYKESIIKLVSIIETQLNNSDFTNTYFEEWFSIEHKNDLNIKVSGKIDKVLTLQDKENTYVVVIDYKTGTPKNLKYAVYGINMQLLYYIYLIYKSNKINNPKFAGMFFQPILDDVLNSKKNKTYEEREIEERRLTGYSTNDLNILNYLDKNMDNSYIRGLSITKEGKINGNYKKALSEEKINELLKIIEERIDSSIKDVNNSNFEINPKVLNDKNLGCEYCEFKDICYMKDKDKVELDENLMENFLGKCGEEDEEQTD